MPALMRIEFYGGDRWSSQRRRRRCSVRGSRRTTLPHLAPNDGLAALLRSCGRHRSPCQARHTPARCTRQQSPYAPRGASGDTLRTGGLRVACHPKPVRAKGGGRGGIRTHETLAGLPVFKTGALNHSATLPSAILPRCGRARTCEHDQLNRPTVLWTF